MLLNILCNIENPPYVNLRSTRVCLIRGWVVDIDGGIESLYLRMGEDETVPCRYPLLRADVEAVFRGIPGARHSGFEADIPMPAVAGEMAVSLVARVQGEDRVLFSKRFTGRRPEEIKGCSIAHPLLPLANPDRFGVSGLLIPAHNAPVFVISDDAGLSEKLVDWVAEQSQAFRKADAFPFCIARDLLVLAKNRWDDEIDGYFSHLGDKLALYGIGHVSIDQVLRGMIRQYADTPSSAHASARPVFALPGKGGVSLVPFLRILFPAARFVCVAKHGRTGVFQNKVSLLVAALSQARFRVRPPFFEMPSGKWSAFFLLRGCSTSLEEWHMDLYRRVSFLCCWDNIKGLLDESQVLEIDTRRFLKAPRETRDQLSAFLGLASTGDTPLPAAGPPGGAAGSTMFERHEVFLEAFQKRRIQAQESKMNGTSGETSAEDWESVMKLVRPHETEEPVFVVGAGRSGTSAMAGALIQGARIPGWHEGHLAPLLAGIFNALAQYRQECLQYDAHNPPAGHRAFSDYLKPFPSLLDGMVEEFLIKSKPDASRKRWIDKTADVRMIGCLPLLEHIFPRARFVFMRRHPIPFALSRQRKFKELPALSFLRWRECMEKWALINTRLQRGAAMEFDQAELTQATDRVVDQLSRWGCIGDQEKADMQSYLKVERPELTRIQVPASLTDGTTEEIRLYWRRRRFYELSDSWVPSLADVGWQANEKALFMELCSDTAEKNGYRVSRDPMSNGEFLAMIAKTLEEYQYTAEQCDKNMAYWANEAKNLREVLAARDEAVQYLAGQLENHKLVLVERDRTIEYLAGQLENHKLVLVERDKALQYLAGQLENHKSVLNERDKALQQLAAELAIARKALAEQGKAQTSGCPTSVQ